MQHRNNDFALVAGIAGYQPINKLLSIVLTDAQDIYNLFVDASHGGPVPDNVQL